MFVSPPPLPSFHWSEAFLSPGEWRHGSRSFRSWKLAAKFAREQGLEVGSAESPQSRAGSVDRQFLAITQGLISLFVGDRCLRRSGNGSELDTQTFNFR